MKRGLHLLTAMLVAAMPATPALRAQALGLGTQVYDGVTRGEAAPATVGALLRDLINGRQGLCLNVRAYQIYRQTAGAATLKADCGPQGVYLVTAGLTNDVRVSGGDGSVAGLNPIDGRIILTTGTAESPRINSAAGAGLAPEVAARVDMPDTARLPRETYEDVRRWSAVGFAATLLFVFALFAHVQASRRTIGGPDRLLPLTSADKDRLTDEATPIADDMHRHPSGVLIVRGRRGKRRLFPNRFYAELYRRTGLKLAQIR